MNKELVKNNLIVPNLRAGEELIGYFIAYYWLSFWWYLIIGPFAALGTRHYYVAVTNHGLHIHKFSFLGKPAEYVFFHWSIIVKMNLGKGYFFAPLKLGFSNRRNLKLRAALIGLAKLDEKTRDYLRNKKL